MKIYSFFIDKIVENLSYILDPREIRHISVLRLKKNDIVRLMDETYEYFGVIQNIDKKEVCVRITDKKLFTQKPKNNVHAFVAIIKNMHEVISSLAELGVEEFTPVITRHSLKVFNREKFLAVAKDSAKQSLGRIMKVNYPVEFSKIDMDKFDNFYIFLEKSGKESQNRVQELKNIEAKRVAFLIGPEAGFSEEERENMRAYSLGEKILRSETAATAAASLLLI